MNTGIHPRVSVNATCTQEWPVDKDIAFYGREGISIIGVMMRKILGDVEGAQRAILSAGLRVSTVAAENRGFDFVTDDGCTDSVAKLIRAIDVAASLSAPNCNFITGRTPSRMTTEDAVQRLCMNIRPAQAYAKRKGIRLAVEHNSTATRENGFIQSLADAISVAQVTDLDVCVELQNCWMELDARRLLRDHTDKFAIVQVSDFVVGTQVRLARAVPGDGDMPLEWLLGNLLEGGYKGIFDLELLGTRVAAEGYEPTVRRGVNWLSERLWSWGV